MSVISEPRSIMKYVVFDDVVVLVHCAGFISTLDVILSPISASHHCNDCNVAHIILLIDYRGLGR